MKNKTNYPHVSSSEINKVAEFNPQMAFLMVLSNMTSKEAESRVDGTLENVSETKKAGFKISIQTPQGVVGLWSCWLENRFYLGYPKNIQVKDETIMSILQVEKSAYLPKNENHGHYESTKFYGPQLPNEKGKVWIERSDFDSNSQHFYTMNNGKLEHTYCGHDQSNGISTLQYSVAREKEVKMPNQTPEAIQSYKEKFFDLLIAIVQQMGGATTITSELDFCIVPEEMEKLGYSNITWLKGSPRFREGWGNDIVRGEKINSNGVKETIILKSANSLVPWILYKHIPMSKKLEKADILFMLTF